MRNSTLLIFLVFIQNGLLAQIEEIPSRLGNLSNNSKEISGARISAEKEASKIAIAAYIKKMNLNISSGEALRVTDVVTLGSIFGVMPSEETSYGSLGRLKILQRFAA